MDGLFDPDRGLVAIALAGGRTPEATLRHEAIHALRAAGLFRDGEWRALKRAARADDVRRERAQRLYPNLDEAAQLEEVIADMFGA